MVRSTKKVAEELSLQGFRRDKKQMVINFLKWFVYSFSLNHVLALLAFLHL